MNGSLVDNDIDVKTGSLESFDYATKNQSSSLGLELNTFAQNGSSGPDNGINSFYFFEVGYYFTWRTSSH